MKRTNKYLMKRANKYLMITPEVNDVRTWCTSMYYCVTVPSPFRRMVNQKIWGVWVSYMLVVCSSVRKVGSLSQVWNGRSDMKHVLSTYCGVTVPLSSRRLVRQSNMYTRVFGCMNESNVIHKVRSAEVYEVSLTKTLRGKPARKILNKVLRGYLCSFGVSVFIFTGKVSDPESLLFYVGFDNPGRLTLKTISS